MKVKIALAAVIILLAFQRVDAGLAEPDGYKRVRVAETYNSAAAQLLIMRLGAAIRDIGGAPPAWQTLPAETAADVEKLGDVMTMSAYDMIIIGDSGYAGALESGGAVKSLIPIWKERIILVGPAGRTEMDGLDAAGIMSRISVQNDLFFSLLEDNFIRASEEELWKSAAAIKTGDNRGYVETSRDAMSALLQAGEEGGFALVGEGSFAQYVESERFEPELVKMAGTDYFKVTFACLLSTSEFRKNRADEAAKYLEWLKGQEAKDIIKGFSIGGMNPFIPISGEL